MSSIRPLDLTNPSQFSSVQLFKVCKFKVLLIAGGRKRQRLHTFAHPGLFLTTFTQNSPGLRPEGVSDARPCVSQFSINRFARSSILPGIQFSILNSRFVGSSGNHFCNVRFEVIDLSSLQVLIFWSFQVLIFWSCG